MIGFLYHIFMKTEIAELILVLPILILAVEGQDPHEGSFCIRGQRLACKIVNFLYGREWIIHQICIVHIQYGVFRMRLAKVVGSPKPTYLITWKILDPGK